MSVCMPLLAISCSTVLASAPNSAPAPDPTTIDGIITAVYDIISGGIGEARDWETFRTLYYPDAKVTHTQWDNGTSARAFPGNLQEWIDAVGYTKVRGFRETEIGRQVVEYGTIAHVFSTYEYSSDDGTMEGRGINSFQLYYDGERYWIMSVMWSPEDDTHPIPDRFLDPRR